MRQSMWLMCAAAALLPVTARAQAVPAERKIVLSANVGVQVGSSDLERNSTFSLYDEPASVDVTQKIASGGLFEIAGRYRVRSRYGVGVAYAFLNSSGDGTIAGSVPHPQLFDQPRTFAAPATDLKWREQSFHLLAVYEVPLTSRVIIALSGGPSVFTVKQALIRAVNFSENPPAFTSITIDSIDVVELKDSGWGFNIGADATYALTSRLGVGAIVRYARGNVDFLLSDTQTAEVKAGGFQIGGGVRYSF